MKPLAVAFLGLVACCLLSIRPAHAQSSEPETPDPTLGQPMRVEVDFELNDILKYDPASGFTVDGYLGLRCDRPCSDFKYLIYNGRATSRDVLLNDPDDQITRMELVLTEAVDLRPYPFDEHRVAVRLVGLMSPDEVTLVANQEDSGLGDIKLQGWQVDPNWEAATNVYFDKGVAAEHLVTYEFATKVRRPVLAGFFKTILPALAILIVGSFGLIIGPEERIKRFDLFNAAFLGTVLFQLSVLSSLPPLGYLTFADRFLLINLISIILGVGSSVWIILDFRAGNKARAYSVHAWLLTIAPLVWLSLQSLNALTMYAWQPSDPRVWIVAAVELAIILAVVPWRRRTLQMVRVFKAGYRRSFRQTRSAKSALAQELDIMASQRPFDVLSKAELETLADLFSPLPDPTVLADVLEEARRTNDVSVLRDQPALERFVAYITDQHASANGQTVVPVASAGR